MFFVWLPDSLSLGSSESLANLLGYRLSSCMKTFSLPTIANLWNAFRYLVRLLTLVYVFRQFFYPASYTKTWINTNAFLLIGKSIWCKILVLTISNCNISGHTDLLRKHGSIGNVLTFWEAVWHYMCKMHKGNYLHYPYLDILKSKQMVSIFDQGPNYWMI